MRGQEGLGREGLGARVREMPTHDVQVLPHHALGLRAQEDVHIQDPACRPPAEGRAGLQDHIWGKQPWGSGTNTHPPCPGPSALHQWAKPPLERWGPPTGSLGALGQSPEPSLLRSLEQDRKMLSSWAWGPFFGLSPTPPRSEVPEPTLEALKDRAGRGHSPLVISRNSVRDPTRCPFLYLQPVR